MTETATIARPTFSVTVGLTDASFEIHMDREWGDDGPYFYEYLALPYEAEVKVLRESEGVAESYAQAAALANLVVRTAPAGSVIMLTVSDGTGQNFCCTGWESREDALATLAGLAD